MWAARILIKSDALWHMDIDEQKLTNSEEPMHEQIQTLEGEA